MWYCGVFKCSHLSVACIAYLRCASVCVSLRSFALSRGSGECMLTQTSLCLRRGPGLCVLADAHVANVHKPGALLTWFKNVGLCTYYQHT